MYQEDAEEEEELKLDVWKRNTFSQCLSNINYYTILSDVSTLSILQVGYLQIWIWSQLVHADAHTGQ